MLLVRSVAIEQFHHLVNLAVRGLYEYRVLDCVRMTAATLRAKYETHDTRRLIADLIENVI